MFSTARLNFHIINPVKKIIDWVIYYFIYTLIRNSICYYVIVCDNDDELTGYKDFGISDDEWKKLISR